MRRRACVASPADPASRGYVSPGAAGRTPRMPAPGHAGCSPRRGSEDTKTMTTHFLIIKFLIENLGFQYNSYRERFDL